MAKRLLLADPSFTIQRVVYLTFADRGYQVLFATSADQALACARERKPDVVLCEALLPGMAGYEVVEALKADPATAAIPVILLYGALEPFDEQRAQQAGAAAWVPKPFAPNRLIAAVEDHLPGPPAV